MSKYEIGAILNYGDWIYLLTNVDHNCCVYTFQIWQYENLIKTRENVSFSFKYIDTFEGLLPHKSGIKCKEFNKDLKNIIDSK